MNTFTNYIGSSKRELLPLAVYYLILLLIAMSWIEMSQIAPSTIRRFLFTAFFALPLFIYRNWALPIITIFATIRLFSVSPYGYLPSQLKFVFYLVLLIFIVDIVSKSHLDDKTFYFSKLSKGLIALLIITVLSNLLNWCDNYNFLYLLSTTIMLSRFAKSKDDIRMLEIAFIVTSICLSIYTFIFSSAFIIKPQIGREVFVKYWNDPNYLGCTVAIGVLISFYYFLNREKENIIFKISYLVVFITGTVVIGMFASRGAFLAVIVPTLYMLYKKTNSIKNLFFVVLFVSILLAAFSNTNYFDSLLSRIKAGDPTGAGRTTIWEASFNKFLQSDIPILMIGGGTDYANVVTGKAFGTASVSTHNNFLQILFDYGFLGLIVFLSLFYSWLNKNSKNVLVVSLVLYFGLVCLTLVPLMNYPYCFLLVLFEVYGSISISRSVQGERLKYLKQNAWRTRRSNSLMKSTYTKTK